MAKGNIFNGLNEEMATIVAETTATGFTPANLFANLLKDKNAVSEYFKSHSDIKNIILDFESRAQVQDVDAKFSKKLESVMADVHKETKDRYVNEVVFMNIILGEHHLSKVFNNVVGKYLKPEYIREDFRMMLDPVPNLEWAKNEETILDVLGRNLTQLAIDGEISQAVGRDEETQRVIQILTRQTKSNPALVGEAGVGKTALVEKLAFVLNDPANVPSSLHNHKLYEISIPAIIATGDVEGTIAAIVKVTSKEKIVIFMDEVHLIMQDKGKIANLLKPAMARGDIKLIGATTEDEYKAFEKDKAMTRRFQPVKISIPDKVTVYKILKAKAEEAEMHHNVIIPDTSLLKAIQLSERYMPSRNQPDKSIDLVEEASAKLRMILESKPEPLLSIENEISDLQIEVEMMYVQHGVPDKGNNGRTIENPRNREKVQELDEKINNLNTERARLSDEYQEQRKLLNCLISQKNSLGEARVMLEEALHRGNFERATQIELSLIPDYIESVRIAEAALLEHAETTDENLVQNVVTPIMIARIIEDQTGIPVGAQDQDDLEKYKNIEVALMESVHGQEKAIREISAAIKRSKAGLADVNKPLGSFLCLGPTGVGKTYLAQKLAEFMFDTDKVLHRFDMSEYMEAHSVARLFGSPPGYVGHDEGGQLTEEIKRNPYSIILFDEIEKAHPRVFDALLQILDAGRMTDGQGHVVDFRNTMIIMTSNIGSSIIKQGLEQGYPNEAIEIGLFDEIKNHFRPEFLNRFDAKVMFNSLSPESVQGIAESELIKLRDRLQVENDLELHWHMDLATMITNEAYDVNDGARPIKRYINDKMINALTNNILEGIIKPGDTVYAVPNETHDDITIAGVPRETLAEIQGSEVSEIILRGTLIEDTKLPNNKVSDDDIVDADIGEGAGKKKKSKSKKKKTKKDVMNMTFDLKTEAGD